MSRGDSVTILDNLSTGRFDNIEHLAAHPDFAFAIDEFDNETVLDRLASQCDVIIHLAAAVGVELVVKSPVHTITTNIGGTEAVLQAARRYRVRTLVASRSEVYGKGIRFPFREDDDVLLGAHLPPPLGLCRLQDGRRVSVHGLPSRVWPAGGPLSPL